MNDSLPPLPERPTLEWFYVDASRQQQGPLSEAALADLFRSGTLPASTLVWREGMADWLAIGTVSQFAAPAAVADAQAPAYDPLPSQASIMPANAEIDRTDIVYAGFWRRFAALVLDSMILGMLSYVVLIPAFVMMGITGADSMGEPDPMVMLAVMIPAYLLIFVLQAVYFAFMHSRPAQASLGKMAVGIKVTGPNGERISFWRGFGRYFAFILAAIPLYIGIIMAAFTDKKRGLHDMICDTLVVDKWAYTTHPQLQKRKLDGVTIAILAIYAVLLLATVAMMVLMVAAIGMNGGAGWN